MSSIQVIKGNSLGINRGLYGATFGNALSAGNITTLIAEGAAVNVGTEAPDLSGGGSSSVVTVSGVFQFGQIVSANLAPGWSCTGYQWTRDGTNISGATSSTYTLVGADIGKAVTVKVTGLSYTGQDGEAVEYVGPELLRFATAFNKFAAGGVGVASGGERRVGGRMHRPFGSADWSFIRISGNNFFLSGVDAITNNPTELNVVGCYVECNSRSVPVSWGGNFNPSFASGARDQQSDKLLPSQFGLTKFARDRVAYLRLELSVPEGGNIPVAEAIESLSNCRSYYTSAGSVNNLAGTGSITFSGTTSATFELPFFIIGEAEDIAADPLSTLGLGDSIFAQGGPSSFYHQACAGSGSNYIAGCAMARGGTISNMFVANSAVLAPFIKYANLVVEEYGTNQVGSTLSTIQSNLQSVWSLLWANKSTHPLARDLKVLRTPLLNRTTDATGATVHSAVWNAGGTVEQLNDWFVTQVGVANRISVLAANLMDSPNLERRGSGTKGVADSDYYKWPAGAVDSQGIHPTAATASGVDGIGANLRIYLLANA